MQTCRKCVLPSGFPGIRFDEQGVCNQCLQSAGRKEGQEAEHQRYQSRFFALLDRISNSAGCSARAYHAITTYSGGKDSSYLLKVLTRDLGLRVFAITFDHGFLSSRTLENIRTVCSALDVDHCMITPNPKGMTNAFRSSMEADIYPHKALQRASSICNTCMHLVKSIVLKKAVEMGVPLIAYGWSPGQAPTTASVMPLNLSMIRQMQGTVSGYLEGIMGENLKPFLLEERHYRMLTETSTENGAAPIYNVNPLALLEYDEEKILEEIGSMGWVSPSDTDPNSTNCLLNAFSIFAHQKKLGFHPYSLEIAGLVREGFMSREEGLARLSAPLDMAVIEQVKKKLGIGETL
jgi:hypothetical protein